MRNVVDANTGGLLFATNIPYPEGNGETIKNIPVNNLSQGIHK